jgi:elongation factor G
MLREFNTNVNVGKPQVVYRETIDNKGKTTATFDRELGGQHHFAEITLMLVPLKRGEGIRFKTEFTPSEETVPPHFVAAVEKGFHESMESGTLMGYPVVDIEGVLVSGTWSESSSELAFRICTSMACKEALEKGNPYLLDPIMKIEIIVPEQFMGDVIGDLNARGGKVEAIESRSGQQAILGIVPLANMFGYSTSLRSATQGRGTFTMQFSHFDRSR